MKLTDLNTLADTIRELKEQGKTVVHCHGVFDLLHIGHIRYFEEAASMGDVLVVTVTPDRFVDKGPYRPAFPEELRAEAVASLKMVHYAAINAWPTAEETLRLLRPDVYVKGSEFKKLVSDKTGKIQRENDVVDEIGARIAFTHDIVFSSSNLINRYLSNLPREIDDYIKLFRTRNSLSEITQLLERMAELRVLVIGDTILDEYQYCEPMGKSTKDPVLTVKYQSRDLFAGGVLAVANHVANFAGLVQLVTVIGERDSHEAFIRSQLKDNVALYHEVQKGAPTLIKRRFVDGYSFNKMFEVYIMDDSGLCKEKESIMCQWLEGNIDKYDLVIASDFGHGAISDAIVSLLCEKSLFLAVNAQANSGNRGFHTVTRYQRADYACIAEHEIRLEMRNKNGSIQPMMQKLSAHLGTKQFVVTRGRKGNVVMNDTGVSVDVPAFATHVVDRVGAGDTVFSLTAMASYLGASDEVIGFLGNVVGAISVGVIGNKKSIDKLSLNTFLTSLLK
ncbi:MAG: adenylyltransferase/cytidyltransferase family protein [Proteobacteria bacterium]|nr:adenylyltransferase/cytidyltransferase family protein [Pseudomonadota bacterium]